MTATEATWAARLDPRSAAALGPVRLIAGLEALPSGDGIWVRGPRLAPAEEAAVRCVPWEARYAVSAGGEIRRAGRLLPEGKLLPGAWVPMREFLRGRAPVAIGGGELPEGVVITLGPSDFATEPTLLEAAAAEWLAWGETAPEIRLARLVYAFDALHPGRALIRGAPLPPIAGQRFVEQEQLAVPAGSEWQPALSATAVRGALGAGETELAILWPDGGFCRVPRSAWIAATRSNLRSTLASPRHVA